MHHLSGLPAVHIGGPRVDVEHPTAVVLVDGNRNPPHLDGPLPADRPRPPESL